MNLRKSRRGDSTSLRREHTRTAAASKHGGASTCLDVLAVQRNPFSHERMLPCSSAATLCLSSAETEAETEVRCLTVLGGKVNELEAMTPPTPAPALVMPAGGADGAAEAGAVEAAGAGVQARPAIRVQICPAAALAAVAAGSNVAAQGRIPAWVLEQSAQTARQARRPVPAKAVLRVEKWLLETSGSELRKARSLETALRAVAHVACVWSSSADDPLHDDLLSNATIRPPPAPSRAPPLAPRRARQRSGSPRRSRSPRRSWSRERSRERDRERLWVRERERSRERSRERERWRRRELAREQEEVDLHVQGLEHYLGMFSERSRALQEERGRMVVREEERRREWEQDRWFRDFPPVWWR